MTQKPVMLLVLDGWGYREKITQDNAIEQGITPNWHNLLKTCPHCFVETSGLSVGLPDGQMGNSEVGHMNLGAGRVVMQDLPRIDQAIKDGSFAKNPVLNELINTLKANGKACHVMGLMSPGGVHSTQDHIVAACQVLNDNGITTYVHAFLDGRDTPPQSAVDFVAEFEKSIANMAHVKLATIEGRFYAMDRDKRWDRIELAYNNMAFAEGKRFETANQAIKASYANKVTDEFVIPCVIGDYQGINDGDAVLMANFRADRAREIGADLIIMGARGLGAVKNLYLGSVSLGTLAKASCPVLICREHYTPKDEGLKIGIAVDGSGFGERCAKFVAQQKDLFGSNAQFEVIFVHADEETIPPEMLDKGVLEIDKLMPKLEHEYYMIAVVSQLAMLRAAGLKAEPVELRGPLQSTLTKYADENLNMVVMGSHGKGALRSLVFGSSTRAMVASCRMPIFIVPGEA